MIKHYCSDVAVEPLLVALQNEEPAPAEVQLLGADAIIGRDGRSWVNSNPDGIVDHFSQRDCDLPIDIEHSTEHKAPQGDPAPAVGWIKKIENRGGEIWGIVEWNSTGRTLVEERQYRYLSPVILYNQSREVVGITSVGLTNRPNLRLTALNQQADSRQEETMHEIVTALNLPETANKADVVAAITALQTDIESARNQAAAPELHKFVPRADYDAVLTRATNAEQALKTLEEQQTEEQIKDVIADALAQGKITPATKEYHIAQCRQAGGLERFADFVKAAPVIAPDSNAFNDNPDGKAAALNAEEKQIASALGITEEEFAKMEEK